MVDNWLPSLKTATPQEGFDLATKLARVGVKVTQPSAEVRDKLRAAYDHDTTQLIALSFPKIISGRIDGAVQPGSEWWQCRHMALSDKPERACEGCWSEAFRPPADATRPGRQNGSV